MTAIETLNKLNDLKEPLIGVDVSKVNRFQSTLGFEYWANPILYRIETSDPEIFLHFEDRTGYDNTSTQMVLYFDGEAISFTGTVADHLSTMPPKNEDGVTVWRVAQIGAEVHRRHPNVTREMPIPERYIRLDTISKFQDQAQQGRALKIVEELVSHFSGAWANSQRGKDGVGQFEVTPDLKEQIETGALIK